MSSSIPAHLNPELLQFRLFDGLITSALASSPVDAFLPPPPPSSLLRVTVNYLAVDTIITVFTIIVVIIVFVIIIVVVVIVIVIVFPVFLLAPSCHFVCQIADNRDAHRLMGRNLVPGREIEIKR